MIKNQSKAYKTAMADKAYEKFRPKMFSCSGYTKAQFDRAAWFSMRPTIYETGIAIGGFKVPEGVDLNVQAGMTAQIMDDGPNYDKMVEVIKYAGEKPTWKGITFDEGSRPCWIVKSLGDPFEVEITTGLGETKVYILQTIPYPDELLDPYEADEPEA